MGVDTMKMTVILTGVACALLSIVPVTSEATIYWTPAHELAPQGHSTTMVAGDLDGDGDCDLSLLGAGPYHYWNIGTAQEPAWELDVGQFGGVIGCSYRNGGLGDVDGDGDLDLAIGCYYEEGLHFYWNLGPPTTPVWGAASSVLEGVTKPIDHVGPRFCDIDADGDLDLLVMRGNGRVWLAENVGTVTDAQFVETGWMEGIPLGSGAGPTMGLGDLDLDGDIDLVRVTWDTPPECFENVGTPSDFEFVVNEDMLTGLVVPPSGYGKGVELLDIDADGDPDMILVRGYGENLLFLNEGTTTSVEPTSWGVIKAMYR